MSRIYFYKLTVDDLGAPCVQDGILSLAICKPKIRCTATNNDFIFGFAANSLHADNRLIFIAKVTKKEINGRYYQNKEYRQRGDCIYDFNGTEYLWRQGSRYHGPAHLSHDLGKAPGFASAQVLLSNDYRYFGATCLIDYKSDFPEIKNAVEDLGRGHRVNHGKSLQDELCKLKDYVWQNNPNNFTGTPSNEPRRTACHRSRSCGVLKMPDSGNNCK